MKETRNLYPQTIVRILYIGILLFHFLMLVLGANAQTTKQKAVREIYTNQIGVREKPGNSGVEVEKYLRYVGLVKGNAWCAAFVCWVYGRAGVVNPRSGWTPDLFGAGKVIWTQGERGKVKGASLVPVKGRGASPPLVPRTADVFGLYFPEKGRIAHVGFIDEWNDQWLITVEGNTNVLGSREGDGVYRKRRLTRSIYKVARYIN